MAACNKSFGHPIRRCALEAGHAEGCSGPVAREVYAQARRARKVAHAQLEAGQRDAVAAAGAGLGRTLTPAGLQAGILAVLGAGGTAAEVLARLEARAGGPIEANRQAVGRREVYQALARLARDGQVHLDGAGVHARASLAKVA